MQAAKRLTSVIADGFDARGWRDTGTDALKLARALISSDREPVSSLGSRFFARNGVTQSDVDRLLTDIAPAIAEALAAPEFEDTKSEVSPNAPSIQRDALIPLDEIDTFKRVAGVTATDVSAISGRLSLYENELKTAITAIIGEPAVETDWGGELSDQFTTHVYIDGSRLRTSFLLKSTRGAPKRLRPRNLGRNGDQIGRMLKQSSQLFVLAHTGGIDESVYAQITSGIDALRFRGSKAIGSVWDGTDCARLLVAYGFLDREEGTLRSDLGDRRG